MSDTRYKIYTKGYCGFCTKAKKLLEKHGLEYDEYKLEQPELMESFRAKFPTAKTVPQIVCVTDGNEEYVGGFTELAQKLSG